MMLMYYQSINRFNETVNLCDKNGTINILYEYKYAYFCELLNMNVCLPQTFFLNTIGSKRNDVNVCEIIHLTMNYL